MAPALSKNATQRLQPLPVMEKSCNVMEGETASQSLPDNKQAHYDFADRPEGNLLGFRSTERGLMPMRW